MTTYVVQGFFPQQDTYGEGWTDVMASPDPEEAKAALRDLTINSGGETAFRMTSRPDPVGYRYTDGDGRYIVQVEFEPDGRRYAYGWEGGTGESLHIGDVVQVPPNWVSPEGGKATVVAYGSEYAGEFTLIERKLP